MPIDQITTRYLIVTLAAAVLGFGAGSFLIGAAGWLVATGLLNQRDFLWPRIMNDVPMAAGASLIATHCGSLLVGIGLLILLLVVSRAR